MQTLFLLGLGIIPVLCPLNFWFGGDAAGDDNLSKIGFANVEIGSWVCWPTAFYVWYVVIVVEYMIFRAMRSFMPLRYKWLKEMPAPRATTVLIEELPEDKNKEPDIRKYFDNNVFGHKVVKDVYVIKDITELMIWNAKLEKLKFQKERNEATGAAAQSLVMNGNDTTILVQIRECEQQIAKLQADMDGDDDLNTTSAFVTFNGPRAALIVLKIFSEDDEEEIVASIPPTPEDILWKDFLVNPDAQRIREIIGYALIVGLFFALMPVVITISTFTELDTLSEYFPSLVAPIENNSTLAAIWEGIMGTLALTLAMSFLPTMLVIIFSRFFILKAQAWLQLKVQQMYFYFLVVFVLLVTAIASGVLSTFEELAENPLAIFSLLAATLPNNTHFYLFYFTTQWVTHGMTLTRYLNLSKYIAYSRIYSRERAHELSEPEDQDYYGMGSRSARFAFLFVTAITFCTLTPSINILAWLEFAICRAFYGYLFVYAETAKPDLGGEFFVTQLKHVQYGMHLYVVLMAGALLQRSSSTYPGIIAGASSAGSDGNS